MKDINYKRKTKEQQKQRGLTETKRQHTKKRTITTAIFLIWNGPLLEKNQMVGSTWFNDIRHAKPPAL